MRFLRWPSPPAAVSANILHRIIQTHCHHLFTITDSLLNLVKSTFYTSAIIKPLQRHACTHTHVHTNTGFNVVSLSKTTETYSSSYQQFLSHQLLRHPPKLQAFSSCIPSFWRITWPNLPSFSPEGTAFVSFIGAFSPFQFCLFQSFVSIPPTHYCFFAR